MTDETNAPQGGAEGVPSTVETNSEATTEQDTGTETSGQADDPGEEAPAKKVPWFQKRIDEVTAKKYEAEREAAYWRGLAEASKRQEPAAQQPVELPTLEQFNYDEAAYQKALTDHIRAETEKSLDQTLSKREREAAERQLNETALTKLRDGGTKYPDFVAAVSDIPATEAVRDFVLSDERAADVLYEMGKDSAAIRHFASLSPVQQAIELGRRASAAPRSKPLAPPPPQTVAGLSSGMNKRPEEMTMAEYAEARKAGKI
jgi:hypothetical protein